MRKILLIALPIFLVLIGSLLLINYQNQNNLSNTDISTISSKNISSSITSSVKITLMKIMTPFFKDNDTLPVKNTCKGQNVNPEIVFSDIPQAALSLVLIMDDPDAPGGLWTHWILYNIAPTTINVPENGKTPESQYGKNSWGKAEWGGACPPSGTHRYIFHAYALDTNLESKQALDRNGIDTLMNGHIIQEATITTTFSR